MLLLVVLLITTSAHYYHHYYFYYPHNKPLKCHHCSILSIEVLQCTATKVTPPSLLSIEVLWCIAANVTLLWLLTSLLSSFWVSAVFYYKSDTCVTYELLQKWPLCGYSPAFSLFRCYSVLLQKVKPGWLLTILLSSFWVGAVFCCNSDTWVTCHTTLYFLLR